MQYFRQNNVCKAIVTSIVAIVLSACSPTNQNAATHEQTQGHSTTSPTMVKQNYQVEKVAIFREPWAMTKLADGRLLITEKAGKLKLFDPKTRQSIEVSGLPQVAYGGQGGLGDIVLHPHFKDNHWIYLSYAQRGEGGYGAAVIRARLDLDNGKQPRLTDSKLIWQQVPKMSGQGHYGHRLMFDHENKLWISSGERQHFDPAQDIQSNLGKILRLNDDGTPAEANPFADQGGVAAQIWSLGHRNPLGMAQDKDHRLWVAEMGPEGGDELNLIKKGINYGYPLVSEGNHYGGKPIPDHDTRPEFQAPEISWTPVISPSDMIIYQGSQFSLWKNKAIISGLSSEAIVIVDITQKPVKEVQRLNMGERIRGVLEADDGSIWVIEDGKNAQLLRLTAK